VTVWESRTPPDIHPIGPSIEGPIDVSGAISHTFPHALPRDPVPDLQILDRMVLSSTPMRPRFTDGNLPRVNLGTVGVDDNTNQSKIGEAGDGGRRWATLAAGCQAVDGGRRWATLAAGCQAVDGGRRWATPAAGCQVVDGGGGWSGLRP
jgi:hypothetical protein